MKLVDDHDVDVGVGPFTKCHVGKDLGGAADDGSAGVHRSVAGNHANGVGAEVLAQRKELLADECLNRCGVETAPPTSQTGEMGCGRDQRLAGTRGGRQDHIVASEKFEDRLLLRRVWLNAGRLEVVEETFEDLVRVVVVRKAAKEWVVAHAATWRGASVPKT